MANRRLLERIVQRTAPAYVESFRPAPEVVADGLWSLTRQLRIPPGPILPTRTTLIRDAAGGVIVVAPPPPHEETFAAIEALGRVAALVAPNSFHYLYLNDAARRFPDASRYLAPGLGARVSDLAEGTEMPSPALGADLEQIVLDSGRGVSEVILYHTASRTLLLTDCAFHLVDVAGVATRLFWRAFGVPAGFGPSRTARLMLLPPREQLAAVLKRVLAWPFERILVAHGSIVDRDARRVFERGFAAYL